MGLAARAWTFTAFALATSPVDHVRNGPKAVELAKRAVEWSGGEPAAMDALAAAYAETGQFADALRVANEAADLADHAGNAALAKEVRARLALYDQGHPFRDPAWQSP